MKLFTCSPLSALTTVTFLAYLGSAQLNYTSIAPRDDTETLASITQLLSLFSISLDVKDFDALSDVFAPDAQLTDDQGDADPLVGLPAIQDFYRTTFQNASLKTQHTSDTVLGFNFGTNTASSVSYASVYYFGPAVLDRGGFLFPNTSVKFREKLSDDYVRVADGTWKISRQGLEIFAIEGDTSILPPF